MRYKERWQVNHLNSILIEGNMVRDAELKHTPNGTPVCNFSIASNRFYKSETGFEKDVGFFQVETWRTLAEACAAKGKKGRGLRAVGRLKQNRWVGADGKNKSSIVIVAEHVEFKVQSKDHKDSPIIDDSLAEQFIQVLSGEDEEVPQDPREDFHNDGVSEELFDEDEAVDG